MNTISSSKTIGWLKSSMLVDVRWPWEGSSLDGTNALAYQHFKTHYDSFLNEKNENLFKTQFKQTMDTVISDIGRLKHSSVVYTEVFEYMRSTLLSSSAIKIERTMMAFDFLIMNSQDSSIWHSISQRKIMKTISLVGRRLLSKGNNTLALCIFNIMRGWAEMFVNRDEEYPYFIDTYRKLSSKHGIDVEALNTRDSSVATLKYSSPKHQSYNDFNIPASPTSLIPERSFSPHESEGAGTLNELYDEEDEDDDDEDHLNKFNLKERCYVSKQRVIVSNSTASDDDNIVDQSNGDIKKSISNITFKTEILTPQGSSSESTALGIDTPNQYPHINKALSWQRIDNSDAYSIKSCSDDHERSSVVPSQHGSWTTIDSDLSKTIEHAGFNSSFNSHLSDTDSSQGNHADNHHVEEILSWPDIYIDNELILSLHVESAAQMTISTASAATKAETMRGLPEESEEDVEDPDSFYSLDPSVCDESFIVPKTRSGSDSNWGSVNANDSLFRFLKVDTSSAATLSVNTDLGPSTNHSSESSINIFLEHFPSPMNYHQNSAPIIQSINETSATKTKIPKIISRKPSPDANDKMLQSNYSRRNSMNSITSESTENQRTLKRHGSKIPQLTRRRSVSHVDITRSRTISEFSSPASTHQSTPNSSRKTSPSIEKSKSKDNKSSASSRETVNKERHSLDSSSNRYSNNYNKKLELQNAKASKLEPKKNFAIWS